MAGHVSLLYIDLDCFKLVNDALGHAAGDALLREVGQRIGTALGGASLLARHGGDEFVVLLGPTDAGPDGNAEHLAERIMATLRVPFALRGTEFETGASVGWPATRSTAATPMPCSSTPTPPCTRPSGTAAGASGSSCRTPPTAGSA
jgi:diguanylate cyclase (GGDEF)-like protein